MAPPPVLVIVTYDGATGQASIMFRVAPPAGPEVASFTFTAATGRVTGPGRPALDLSAADALANTAELQRWTDRVDAIWTPSRPASIGYQLSIERPGAGPPRIVQNCTVGFAALKVDAKGEWKQATDVVHLNARGALDLSWTDFLHFVDCYVRFIEAIDRF